MPLEPKLNDEEDFAELLLDCTPWEEDDSAVEEDEDCAELLDDSSELWVGTASEDSGSTPLDVGPDEEVPVGFPVELEDAEAVSEDAPSPPELLGVWALELSVFELLDKSGLSNSLYSNPPKALSNSAW